jgi:FkbM family methyltransferase
MSQTGPRPTSPLLRAYRFVNRPYYLYRPSQLVLRLRAGDGGPPDGDGELRLLRTAWGSRLYCWPDPLGLAVARNGVYDLTVAETLARLAEAGETVVDAGANVGLMSNLLAHAVGPAGRVVSFEPHPLIYETLSRNVTRWRTEERLEVIEPRRAAVSSSAGFQALAVDPATFAANKGTASLQHDDPDNATDVRTVRLQDELDAPVGVMKLDVEMHELEALRGAEDLLSRRLVRDIVFEEHEPPPTPVTDLLEDRGYTVLGVRQGLTGPLLSDPAEAYAMKLWDPPALLATTDPERARRRLKPRGYRTLRPGLGRRVS